MLMQSTEAPNQPVCPHWGIKTKSLSVLAASSGQVPMFCPSWACAFSNQHTSIYLAQITVWQHFLLACCHTSSLMVLNAIVFILCHLSHLHCIMPSVTLLQFIRGY